MRKILINLDGLGDISYKILNNKTPLEAAKTPNLDFLANKGKTGLMYVEKGIAPESDFALFSMFGYSSSKYPGRGIIEALGFGLKINKNYTYLRGNFAKIKNNYLIEAQTNLPSKQILKKINSINKNIQIVPTLGHRCIVIIKKKVSLNISNYHPGYKKVNNYTTAIPRSKKLKLRKVTGNKETSKLLNNFIKKSESILKNKTILMRGISNKLPKLKKVKNWSILADTPVDYGVAKLVGMKPIKKTSIIQQIKNIKSNVFLQIKGPDTYSHKGNPIKKKKEIEKIDKFLKPLKNLKNTIICITADHSSLCKTKAHSSLPVPILISGKGQDNIKSFSEKSCKRGILKKFKANKLLTLL
ncbi:MAG: hypothetical protein Q8R00_03300 [Candidatus Nanoarchaeia archaeon]|nr:hypothetical protein [Candidatus Nanoarchaeia archaeon]